MSAEKEAKGATETPVIKAVAKTEEKKQGNLMYLGPTITGVVRHSTILKNGIFPERVKECVKQFPMMEKLFIAMDNIPDAVKELRKEQSVLGTIYTQTANKFK